MIKHIPLNQNILTAAVDEIDADDCLLLFPTRKSKKEAQKLYQQKWDFSIQHFYTMDEWKETLFISDKPLLKEEKRTLALYVSLTPEQKEFFQINTYHQFIDFAHNFFNFWQELIEEKLEFENIEELLASRQTSGNWQMNSFYNLYEIKQNYREYLRENEFDDPLFSRHNRNLQIPHYNKIIVVNQFYFTKFEKDILKKFDSKTVILTQVPADCFDDESLSIKEFNAKHIKAYIKAKPRILHSADQTQMIFQLGNELKGKAQATIIDFQLEKQPYYHLLSDKYCSKSASLVFSKTRFFRFFKIFYDILNSIIWEGKPFLISLKSILNLISSDDILEYLVRDIESREKFKNEIFDLTENDYKFIDLELFETRRSEQLHVIEKIYKLLSEFRKIETLKQLVTFLHNQIDLEYLLADFKTSSNLAEVFFESLADFMSIEEIELLNNWQQIFPHKRPENLLKLFLDYLKPKNIQIDKEISKPGFEFTTLHDTRNLQFYDLFILNAVEGILPDRKHTQFLLSENQRKVLGLKTYEDITMRDKFYFYRLICNAENLVVFTRSNLEENIEISSFIEELKINNLVEEIESVVFSNVQKDLFSNLLENKKLIIPDKDLSENFHSFPFKSGDFPDKQIDLSFYKWEKLQHNPFEFYLEFVCKLKKHIVEVEEDFSAKLIGTIAHEIITLVWKRLISVYSTQKFKHNFVHNTKQYVQQAIGHYLQHNRDFKYISPHNFSDRYFHKVFIPILAEGIENFFYRLHNDLKLSDITIEVFPETDRSEKKQFTQVDDFTIFLKGRPDLRIHKEELKYVFDFKTGSVDTKKVKRYNKQLQFYEQICYSLDVPGIIDKINSYLFFVEQEDMKPVSNRIDLKQEIKESLKQVIANGFGLAEKADSYEDVDVTRRDLLKGLNDEN